MPKKEAKSKFISPRKNEKTIENIEQKQKSSKNLLILTTNNKVYEDLLQRKV
mgnify:CR=1 FL=1